jgi:hypothetical protein
MISHKISDCYTFKEITTFNSGLLDKAVDATYILHLEGNGRYNDIINNLKDYHPTRRVYILINKGFRKCKKQEHIKIPMHDVVDAFLQVFYHANRQNYDNILILEDDFFFSEKIKKQSTQNEICMFLNKRKHENFQYRLGCIPYIQIPYTYDFKHYRGILSTGTHAVVYSKQNRIKTIQYVDNNNLIDDWDLYFNLDLYTNCYMYHEPLCYQLFPETENSKDWGYGSNIIYVICIFMKYIYKLLKLDTQYEPGYTYFYIFSKIFLLILFFITIILIIIAIQLYYLYKNPNNRKNRKR